MSDTNEPILEIDGLSKYFSQGDSLLRRLRPDQEVKYVHAVDEIDLTVYEGETLGLVGESGCGKSTLARTILQLIEPTAGSVYYRGEDVTTYSKEAQRAFRSEAQMIFQDPNSSLNPRYSVRKTLTEPMAVHGIGENEADRVGRAIDLLERVGLGGEHLDRYPHEFSGGQRQRIGIARALAVDPQLIVADEPVSALDVSIQAQILELLAELQAEMNLTMLFISHNLSVVRYICDRVAVMYLGNIVETTTAPQLFGSPKHPYTQSLISSIPVPNPEIDRDRIHLEGDVPTPIDPPTGCRFHTRCPNVIPPTDWQGSDEAWRRVIQLKTRIEGDMIQPAAVRSQLEHERDEEVTDQEVIQQIYENNFTDAEGHGSMAVSLPSSANEIVTEAISALTSAGQDRALAVLDGSFDTVCARDQPTLQTDESNDAHAVMCHLYDESKPGEPLEERVATTGLEAND